MNFDPLMRFDDVLDATYAAAFRAGAEAMREAAAKMCESCAAKGYPVNDSIIRDLPLPEPPK